jgi:hypothetical protein
MANNVFNPKPGRFGTAPTFVNVAMTTVPASGVTTLTTAVGAMPTTSVISKFSVSAITYPAGATVNAKLVKSRSGESDLDLTAATVINGLTAGVGKPITLVSTLTDVQKTILPTDTLKVVTSGTGTVTTASVGLMANVELMVTE